MRITKRRGQLLALVGLIMVLGAVLLLRWHTAKDNARIDEGYGLSPDAALSDSGPAQPSREEVFAELNRQIEENEVTLSMNPDPTFETGTSEGNVMIRNEDSNHHSQVVQILRDDTDEVIYTSGAIPVGKQIRSDTLAVALDAGDYPCTAYFSTVDEATGQILSTGALPVTVHILG